MRARSILVKEKRPSRTAIAKGLGAHLCRCTGYVKIVDAIDLAARVLDGESFPEPDWSGKVGSSMPRYQAEELGGRPGIKPLPVGAVVVTQYQSGKRWRPQSLSAGRGVLALLEHTVPARRRPGFALTRLQQVVAGARILSGVRGEAEETVSALLDLW